MRGAIVRREVAQRVRALVSSFGGGADSTAPTTTTSPVAAAATATAACRPGTVHLLDMQLAFRQHGCADLASKRCAALFTKDNLHTSSAGADLIADTARPLVASCDRRHWAAAPLEGRAEAAEAAATVERAAVSGDQEGRGLCANCQVAGDTRAVVVLSANDTRWRHTRAVLLRTGAFAHIERHIPPVPTAAITGLEPSTRLQALMEKTGCQRIYSNMVGFSTLLRRAARRQMGAQWLYVVEDDIELVPKFRANALSVQAVLAATERQAALRNVSVLLGGLGGAMECQSPPSSTIWDCAGLGAHAFAIRATAIERTLDEVLHSILVDDEGVNLQLVPFDRRLYTFARARGGLPLAASEECHGGPFCGLFYQKRATFASSIPPCKLPMTNTAYYQATLRAFPWGSALPQGSVAPMIRYDGTAMELSSLKRGRSVGRHSLSQVRVRVTAL